jgi:hypothetical protein
MIKHRLSVAVLVLVGVLVLGACGGGASSAAGKVASLAGGATPTTSGAKVTQAQYQSAMLAYAACMRKNGVNMPDPQFDSSGRATFGGDRPGSTGGQSLRSNPNFDRARTACRSIRQSVQSFFALTPAQQAVQQKALLAFAACMRSKGVNFPDPQFDANGRPQFGGSTGRNAFDKLRNDPKYQAASGTCRTQAGVTGGLGRGFGGGGFGGGGRGRGGSGSATTPTTGK